MAANINTIKSAVYGLPPVEIEGITGAAPILPGMILMLLADGTYVPHLLPNIFVAGWVAVENQFHGKSVEDAYQPGDKLWIIHGRPGDVLMLLLQDGTSCTTGQVAASSGLPIAPGYIQADDTPPVIEGTTVGICLETHTAVGLDYRVPVEIT